MKMTNSEYRRYVEKKSPPSPLGKNLVRAFASGGLICCIGQGFGDLYTRLGVGEANLPTAVCITMIFLGALLTGLGVYDRLAKFAGAGTLVPITGFANAIVSPTLEFKSEGIITGLSTKMFAIAGPVLVSGVTASVVYGLLLILFGTLS